VYKYVLAMLAQMFNMTTPPIDETSPEYLQITPSNMKPTTIFNLLLATGASLAAPTNPEPETTLTLETRPDSTSTLIPRSGDDYPYKNSCNTAHDIDPWNFYKCECTSFVAWRINNVKKIKFTNWYKGQHWGNAELWDDAARKSKVKINKTPKRGAIAQTDKSGSGLGHVAWVKSVSKDGKKVTVEEYNYHKDKYGVRTVDKDQFQNYIHL
jgi:surface antigen